MNLSDQGLEIVLDPILQVRLSHYRGMWFVEYKRKPKFYFDQWWWFDDSTHKEYNDAYIRAQTLAAQGGTKVIREKQAQTFNVKSE
jgi:hypothetical protein